MLIVYFMKSCQQSSLCWIVLAPKKKKKKNESQVKVIQTIVKR